MTTEEIRAKAREMGPKLEPVDVEALLVTLNEAREASDAAGRRPAVGLAAFISQQDALIRELLDLLDVDHVQTVTVVGSDGQVTREAAYVDAAVAPRS